MIDIVVVSYNNAPPAQPLSAHFGQAGGTIGRSGDNLFVLPDPKHHVSRFQASITSDGVRHSITNLSQANPTLLNGLELACDVAQPLRDGDEIRIGLYVLRAEAVTGTHAPMTPPTTVWPLMPPAPVVPVTPPSGLLPGAQAARSAHAARSTMTWPEPLPVDAEPADAQALLQAFLAGAGIPSLTLSSGLTPELMEMIGGLLSCAMDGTIDLLAMRALVKREANADVTMVVVRNNNPLKFLPDGATVLTQMLRKRMPGFMSPVEAMQDAYDDLHAHQIGLMAGMHAAVLDQHRQLEPAAIDDADGAGSILDRMFPAIRKARIWDCYCERHRQAGSLLATVASAAGSKAFLTAYERSSEQYLDEAANER